MSDRTVTRRTWLEWFGGASAVSLASLMTGCGGTDDDPFVAAHAADAGRTATGRDLSRIPATGIIFAATADQDTTISPWGENTVDPQDEAALIASWSLTIDGLVDTPVTLTFADLLALDRQDQVTDFHCVEGWSVYDVPWNGVHMSTLAALVTPTAAASHVTLHCVPAPNGRTYDESLPLDVAMEPKTLMAYGADDRALPLRHGFPLRCVIPRLYGYKGAKAVQRIEFTDKPVDGFWVVRGYPYDAPVDPDRLREGKY